jgi:hypothetical protein
MTTYTVVRSYTIYCNQDTIKTGLTLEQAQAHCRDPEASSDTCTEPENVARTAKDGPWFDDYYRCGGYQTTPPSPIALIKEQKP